MAHDAIQKLKTFADDTIRRVDAWMKRNPTICQRGKVTWNEDDDISSALIITKDVAARTLLLTHDLCTHLHTLQLYY